MQLSTAFFFVIICDIFSFLFYIVAKCIKKLILHSIVESTGTLEADEGNNKEENEGRKERRTREREEERGGINVIHRLEREEEKQEEDIKKERGREEECETAFSTGRDVEKGA